MMELFIYFYEIQNSVNKWAKLITLNYFKTVREILIYYLL